MPQCSCVDGACSRELARIGLKAMMNRTVQSRRNSKQNSEVESESERSDMHCSYPGYVPLAE